MTYSHYGQVQEAIQRMFKDLQSLILIGLVDVCLHNVAG